MSNRLIVQVALHTDQAQALTYLMNMEGFCTCGLQIRRMDPRYVLCKAISEYAPDKKDQNTLTMAAYCKLCFERINEAMAQCRRVHMSEANKWHEKGN